MDGYLILFPMKSPILIEWNDVTGPTIVNYTIGINSTSPIVRVYIIITSGLNRWRHRWSKQMEAPEV